MQTKSIFPLLVIIGLWVTSVALSEPSFQVSISAGNSETSFSLRIQNPVKKKIRIEVSHTNFGLVADTVINEESYSKSYNMNEADDGKYLITVSAGREKVIKEIELNTVTVRNMKIRE